MKLSLRQFCLFIFAIGVLGSFSEKSASAALPNNINVQDCLENPELCQQESNEETVSTQQAKASSAVGIGFLDVVRMIAALVFVIALLYFLLKFINKKSMAYQDSQLVRNLGGTALGGSRSLQIVKAGDRILILGVGDNVSLLTEIKEEAEYQAFLSQYSDQSSGLAEPVVNRLKKKWESSFPQKPATGFSEQLKKQINEIQKKRTQAVQKAADLEQNRHE